MQKLALCTAVALVFSVSTMLSVQQTAMNFQRADCNGVYHDLYSELDSGNCIVLEYFMTCSSCSNAAHRIQPMMQAFSSAIQGKLKFYMLAYTNSYGCSTVKSFLSDNAISAIPCDSGAKQVAYYGGFGMPTVVIVAGKDHRVLWTDIGFSSGDEVAMKTAISDFFGIAAVGQDQESGLRISPQPCSGGTVKFQYPVSSFSEPTLTICNAVGQDMTNTVQIRRDESNGIFDLDASMLPAGCYFSAVRDNKKCITKVFCIAH